MSTRKQQQSDPEPGIGKGFLQDAQGLAVLASIGTFEEPNEVRAILRDKWGLELPPIEYPEGEPREEYQPLPPPPMFTPEEEQ